MKSHIKKLSVFALVAGLLVTLAGRNVVNAEEEITNKEEIVDEVENNEPVLEEPMVEETNEVEEGEQTSVQQLSGITPAAGNQLEAGVTTLGEAFPDAYFRQWVAETVLGLSVYDEDTILTAANITTISTRTVASISGLNDIESLEGIKYFKNLYSLGCSAKKLTKLDVSGLSNLTYLTCINNEIRDINVSNTNITNLLVDNNKITSLDVSTLSNLQVLQVANNQLTSLDVSMLNNLTTLNVHENPISELNVSAASKGTLTTFHYRNTNIESLDLTGFTSLTSVSVTKSTGGNLSTIGNLQVSGSRDRDDRYMIRLYNTTGVLSRDTSTGYYIIAPSATVQYKFHIPLSELAQGAQDTALTSLPEGGVLDNEGNLIVGAVASNIASDGTITLPTGGTIITPEGTFVFSGSVSIKDGVITTSSDYKYEKNNATYDAGTGTGIIGDVVTSIEVGDGPATINTVGGASEIPAGSTVTNDNGDKTYVIDGGSVDSDGAVISDERVITVPSDKTGSITVDTDGNITLPAGSIVSENGTDVTYPGTIVYDPEDSTVKYLPIDELLSENGSDLATGITQGDITNAKDFVDGLTDSDLKTELQNKVEIAQDILNAKDAVEDLYDTDGKLKEDVTQEDLDNAKDLVNKIPDGDLKEELKDKLEEAQKELNEREAEKAVDDLFDEDGKIKDSVTQDDIDNAQDLVNKVTDEDKKKELQDKLDEAQKQYDEKHFTVLEAFETFTGAGTVYTKIDAPVEKFSKVYVDGKELDASNYTVTSGSTVVTLSEAYLKTLGNGTYDVEVEFASGARVDSPLTVDVKSNPSKPPVGPTTPGNPTTSNPSINANNSSTSGSGVNSGDTTNNTLYFMMLVSSLAVLGMYAKREKK